MILQSLRSGPSWNRVHGLSRTTRRKSVGSRQGLLAGFGRKELEKLGAVKHCVGVDPAEVAPADYQHGLCIFCALHVGSAW